MLGAGGTLRSGGTHGTEENLGGGGSYGTAGGNLGSGGTLGTLGAGVTLGKGSLWAGATLGTGLGDNTRGGRAGKHERHSIRCWGGRVVGFDWFGLVFNQNLLKITQ